MNAPSFNYLVGVKVEKRLEAYYDEIATCHTEEAVWQALRNFLEEAGIRHIAYGYGYRHDSIQKKSTLPVEWEQYYRKQNYAKHDVILHHCMASRKPLFTSLEKDLKNPDLPRKFKRIIDEVAGFGYRTAMVIPLYHGKRYPPAGINLSTEFSDLEFDREIRPQWSHIKDAVRETHTHMMDLLAGEVRQYPKLSPQQRAVYQLLATGRTRTEISHQMGIKLPTVDLHLRAGRIKLDARTSYHALAKAVAGNLIRA